MKKLLSAVLTAVMMLSLVACSSNEEATTTQETAVDEELKIISLAPATTEILTDLGITSELVAVDMYVGEGYENLVAFDAFAPDIEAILALDPDIIFVSGMTDFSGTDLYAPITQANAEIEIVNIPTATSIEQIYQDINLIASKTGKTQQGEELVSTMKAEIEEIKAIGQTIEDKKSVYFEVANLYPTGSGTYINEMIEIIGATNVFSEQEGWISASEEEVIARNADVFLTSDGYTQDVVNTILDNANYQDITAIKNGDVYLINPNSSARPNHRITVALKEMAVAVYGQEIFGE